MVDRHPEVPQPALFRPPVLTLTLTVGIVHESEHAQAQIEVRSATDHVLLELVSWPHMPLSELEERFREIGRVWTAVLREHSGPFSQ